VEQREGTVNDESKGGRERERACVRDRERTYI